MNLRCRHILASSGYLPESLAAEACCVDYPNVRFIISCGLHALWPRNPLLSQISTFGRSTAEIVSWSGCKIHLDVPPQQVSKIDLPDKRHS